ncbi:hypothetical protein BCR42DRAFT_433398 [Absidia repens]|uniref:Uncharacterized protein n=1 Tax=Absidia repens TaxID=90262 RepID=A0A1X2ITI0_9FUNG|nr:hypothetical protein BCR42DRAFT_433398 [Absidia repens]
MLNEGAADCLLPMTRKASDDVIVENPHHHHQPSYPDHLVKKWTERVDRCLEQQWKDSQRLLSYAKALKDSGGTIPNSDDIVKELSGLGFTMMQKSIDLRQEIVNETYNTDFFDCHIKKPVYQYHHDNNNNNNNNTVYNHHSHSSQCSPNQYPYSRPSSVGALNSPRQKCSSSFYLPFSSQLNQQHTTPLLSNVPKQPPFIDRQYKIPSEVSGQGYSSSLTYHRPQRARSNSFTPRQLTSSTKPTDKKIGIPLLSSSPSVSNVCSLSLGENNSNAIKGQQRDNTPEEYTPQQQCSCSDDSPSITTTEPSVSETDSVPTRRCQHCTSIQPLLQPDHEDSTPNQIMDNNNNNNNFVTMHDTAEDGTPLADNNNIKSCDINIEQSPDNNDINQRTAPLPISHTSTPLDTTDDIFATATPTSPLDNSTTIVAAAAASLAAHITPSTPCSSFSMVHTMSTKFHFTRSATSLIATPDKNKTMSRSSSSSSSASSSASMLAATAAVAAAAAASATKTSPSGAFSNKDGEKSSTRFVQSLLGRKTSLPALFQPSSKKDQPLAPASSSSTQK